jgi:large exoprotein involved in heme utilization and adhesion
LETLRVLNNSQIEATTNTGQAGDLSANLGGEAAQSVLVSGNSELSVAATGDNADSASGLVSINTRDLTVEDSSTVSASTNAGQGQGIELQNLENLRVNNSLVSSSTESGVAGSVDIDASQAITVNNGLISSSATSGVAGSIEIDALESVTLSGIFNTTASGEPEGGVLATATEGGTAGSVRINTEELTIENGAAAAVSSRNGSGIAGDINITSQEVTLSSGGEIAAETDAGGRDRPSNIILQGLETLEMDGGTISASTNTGGAGNVSIDASDSVELDDDSRIAVIATGENGTAGNLTVNTGDFLVRDNSEVSVSSPEGFAGNLNVNADFIALNRGRITAEAGQGDGGANINLNVRGFLDLNSGGLSGFLRLDNESLISALATGDATGGNIDISAQFVIASFPTGSQGSDIVADAVFGNGGQINISALGIFGIQFRPERTPLNDITANSQSGSSGTVQLVTLGIDPSRGLAALPLNFVDVSGLVGGQCSVGSGAELGRFTIIGRGGLPLNPTDPLTPEADRADWVSLDPETDELSLNPEATTQIHLTPFNTSVTSRQLAEFPALCYQSLSSPTVTPE